METFAEASGSGPVFKFTDYDCIGFDLDNTLARYKVGEMIDLEYQIMSNYLVKKRGYNGEHLLKPMDHSFILKGLIVDDDHGNVLRIDPTGKIIMASHGTKMLSDDEIVDTYPDMHWKGTDAFIGDPISNWHCGNMGPLIDYYDIAVSGLFARAVDSVDEIKGRQNGYGIWSDIVDAMIYMFTREHCRKGIGEYFPALMSDPEKYYYKCSDGLLEWLKELKSRGILLFMVTGSNTDFATHTALNTLGPGWDKLFDLIICYARKPGFFTKKRPFYSHLNGAQIDSYQHLIRGGTYTEGNWDDVYKFLSRYAASPKPRFLYVGDNLVHDIYTPSVQKKCDTVAICEELEAEGHYGHQQWHPDAQFLVSSIWGSFFRGTNWQDMMFKHSKLSIPSVEYAATLPIDHAYRPNL